METFSKAIIDKNRAGHTLFSVAFFHDRTHTPTFLPDGRPDIKAPEDLTKYCIGYYRLDLNNEDDKGNLRRYPDRYINKEEK
jgi:hypothetical protein